MTDVADRISPLEQLRRSLPDLPERLREAGRFIAAHEFDATTRSMRDLAAEAGLQPATFTRLAQAIGHAGWDEFRHELVEARRPEPPRPYSDRAGRRVVDMDRIGLVTEILVEEAASLARLEAPPIIRAATAIRTAPRIWIAGFRSCRAVAGLLHYQLSLFRPDTRLVGGSGPEDLDVGAFGDRDAVVVIGFAPYSRASLFTVRHARRAGCTLVAVADRPTAPIAEGADHVLIYDAGATPAFFHSLTGAVATVQALAAAIFEMDGPDGAARLRRTEARLAAHGQYLSEEDVT